VNTYPITVQATPAAVPSQFQTRTVNLTETSGSGVPSVTLVYFGPNTAQGWPTGPTFSYPFPSTAPVLIGVGVPYTFKVTAVDYSNYTGCVGPSCNTNNSTGVQLLITFSEPVNATASVTFNNVGGDGCATQNSTSILCNLNTIPYTPTRSKEVTVTAVPAFGRTVDAFVTVSSSAPNPGYPSCNGAYANSTCTIIHATTNTRPRPMVRPGQMPGNTNPK
jgi:hypothetical protein